MNFSINTGLFGRKIPYLVKIQELVECVPNFSEGRKPAVIEAISDAIASVEGVKLLHVDPNEAANRTVYTFIGTPQAVCDAAFSAISVASAAIDMRVHKGEHLRMGACDVCPLIPLAGISTEQLNKYALSLSERIGTELGLSVYNYEFTAKHNSRRRLEQIRKGQYEALPEKLMKSDWEPDFGPAVFNSRFGAMVLGVRKFLLAYNINLKTKDVAIAQKMASALRESGSSLLINGERRHKPGLFKALKAIGWYIADFDRVQVSCNITDFEQTSIAAVYEAAEALAEELGTGLAGSELVGLLPLQAALRSADYFFNKSGVSPQFSEREKIEYLCGKIGLRSVKPFEADKQIIEYIAKEFFE